MSRLAWILVLITAAAWAAYTTYVVVAAGIVRRGEGADPAIFWPTIGVMVLTVGVALWIARRAWHKLHF